ncbi:MAG: hypothetical protein FJZ98_05215 [Chloroflexi bacterium]|nr:hypothetical protein [Chloroflexota bacterium]
MAVMRPLAFHGAGKRGPFFEGWYFKNVSGDGSQRWSIIPGVYIGRDPQDSHSFIQFMDGASGKSWFVEFPFSDFKADATQFKVQIGNNEFSQHKLKIDVQREDLSAQGELEFIGTQPWPVTLLSPGIMGWFAWVPGMECYHGVVSLDHSVQGKLTINGEEIDLSDGRGYIEKDWGKAMPMAWVWAQTNHFSRPGTSLTLSVADIPFGPLSFNGFLAGLLLDGELYKFATYTGARISTLHVGEREIRIIMEDDKKRLEVSALRGKTSDLQAPTVTQMDRRIAETLSAEIKVGLSLRQGDDWHTVFEDTGKYAGLEIVGKLDLAKF